MSKLKSSGFFWPLIIVLALAALLLPSLFTGTESCLLNFNFFDIGFCVLYWEDVIIIALIGFIAYLTISRVLIWIFSPAQKWVGMAFNGLAILAVLGSAYFWGMPLATLYRKFVTAVQTQSDQSKCNQAMKQTGFANDTIQIQNFRAEPVFDSQNKIQAFDLKFSLTSNFAGIITISPQMGSPAYSFGEALLFRYQQLPDLVAQVSPGKEVTVAVRFWADLLPVSCLPRQKFSMGNLRSIGRLPTHITTFNSGLLTHFRTTLR